MITERIVVGDGKTMPAKTPLSRTISNAVRKLGFQFEEPVIVYAWSPVVRAGAVSKGLSQIEGLELVTTGRYKERVEALRKLALKHAHDTQNPVFLVPQILEQLRDDQAATSIEH